MANRTQRLLTIRKIISRNRVSNQEELKERMRNEGYKMTQATLSRDLKFLKAGKIPDNREGYMYVLPDAENQDIARLASGNFPVNGYISIDFAHNLAVMKVLPGYASSIASAIDHLESWEIVGTIAGDDTILIIPREGIAREDIRKVLGNVVSNMKQERVTGK